jgi:WD40 repeat protein
MSGHKEAVTAVKILDMASSKEIYSDGGHVVISGSTDCCAKFWHVPTGTFQFCFQKNDFNVRISGKELSSIYTFNAITCVGYINNDCLLVTATEGGKLELFDAKSGKNLSSVLAFELPVVSMKV